MGDVNLRKTQHNLLCNILNQVKAHSTTPLTYNQAIAQQELAGKISTKLEQIQERLVSTATDDAAVIVQESAYSPIVATQYELTWRLKDLIASIPKPASATSSSSASVPATVRLPQIELPPFDGNYAAWSAYKDLFKATVDSNTSLATSQKLQYLKSSLQGKPYNLISDMLCTNANYAEAWKILDERYSNPREIVGAHINSILTLKPIHNESAEGLQTLIDTTEKNMRALKVLGQPVDHWDIIIIFLLLSKVDANTRKEWAIRQTTTTLPTLTEFRDFISSHIRGLLANKATTSHHQDRRKDKHVRVHQSSTGPTCQICKGPHYNYRCTKLTTMPVAERADFIRRLHLCLNCLNKGHKQTNCPNTKSCYKCQQRHHTLLHDDQNHQPAGGNQQGGHTVGNVSVGGQQLNNSTTPQIPPQGNSTQQQSNHVSSSHVSTANTQVLLATAIVKIKDKFGQFQLVRVFLDEGSQATMITEECMSRLKLPRGSSSLSVRGVSNIKAGRASGSTCVRMYSRYNESNHLDITAHIFPKVTAELPNYAFQPANWSHIRGLQLADPQYYHPSKVDILIGAEYVNKIKIRDDLIVPPPCSTSIQSFVPDAQNTLFGWVLSGRVPIATTHAVMCHHGTTEEDIHNLLQKFWEVENPPQATTLTEEEKQCEDHFQSTYSRDQVGRFTVRIPFNQKIKDLGLSREAAVRRFQQVERRLEKNPDLRCQYVDFIREYQRLGHLEKVPPSVPMESPGATYYLPHHCVINQSSSTTKLRVVFDGSAKTTSNLSLNDCMMVGPTVQDDLYTLLLRFRLYPVVLKADITKMFRQFRLNPSDADYHRILWREARDQPIQDYRLTTVTYGTACAPYLATRCLQQLGKDVATKYPMASKAILNDHYVDDLMGGDKNDDTAIQLYHQLTEAAAEAGLELRKWSSNSPTVLEVIPEDQRELNPQEFDPDHTVKALGVQWIPATDQFVFKYIPPTEAPVLTKRRLLSDLAKMFDPLGLISPIIVRAKLQLQELWKLSIDWDQEVPPHIQQQWNEYQSDLQQIPLLSIPRFISQVNPPTSETSPVYQLHGFADASEVAFGAVIYLRTTTDDNNITARMITSKTKVAPLKQASLPRLELMAAVLLSEMVEHIKQKYQLTCEVFLWSDSTITLRWIASHSKRWKTFVANRVERIQRKAKGAIWRHVPGTDNPADLASRGASVSQLSDSDFWWTGPTWLSEPELPTFPMNVEASHSPADLEQAKSNLAVLLPEVEPNQPIDVPPPTTYQVERSLPELCFPVTTDTSILDRFSSLNRCKRVTAFLFRFHHNSMPVNRPRRKLDPLSPTELHQAMQHWIRQTQGTYFVDEIRSVKKNGEVQRGSKLINLKPYLDGEGILRVTGRLQNAKIPESRKHQVILPNKGHLTELIIRHYHLLYLHSGFQLTWEAIQREFWITRGRDRVRHYLHRCVICRRHRAKAAEQLMGSLPSSRVTPTRRPFLHTGVDYAGPFNLKNPVGRAPKIYKGYLCIFVCMATKAIHLEAVSALTTEAFIATLRRFVSRRGLCADLYSDCGTNFVGADKELAKLVQSSNWNHEISDHLATSSIQWHFNTPASPHQGGLWEAGVKSVKSHLRHVMGTSNLTFEHFTTVLCQIEAILNSRPLYQSSSDPTDFLALTPGHFLIGDPLLSVPDVDYSNLPTNRLDIYQQQQQRIQYFWRRWSSEYLNTLQQRNKWKLEKDNLKPDDLVLLTEKNLSPGQWAMGRVVRVQEGDDGKVRRVTIKTATTELQRPINRLVPLFNNE